MIKNFYLIRHGNTKGTTDRLFYGSTDLPLTQEGKNEIKKLCKKGIYPLADNALLYTSGMLRTEETFEIIYGKLEHSQVSDLRELGIGNFEMKTYEEVMENEEGKAWLSGEKKNIDFPGGDTHNEFNERIKRGLNRIFKETCEAGENKEKAIAVLHGAVIASAMTMMFPGVKEDLWRWIPDPGCGYKVVFRKNKPVEYKIIR